MKQLEPLIHKHIGIQNFTRRYTLRPWRNNALFKVESEQDLTEHCRNLLQSTETIHFIPEEMGQLGTYVVAVNHLLKKPEDNPTLGLLVCKNKDNILAKYALESSSLPIAVSEY